MSWDEFSHIETHINADTHTQACCMCARWRSQVEEIRPDSLAKAESTESG